MTQGETEPQLGIERAPTGRLLFGLLGAAVAWSLHFLGSYALASIGCVAGWQSIRTVLAVATLVFGAIAVWSALVALREWRRVSGDQSLDVALGEPRGWLAFLMLTGVMLGAVSVLAIVLEGFGTLTLAACGWNVR